nr:TRAP transporter substrate-binding protein [Luminiphilus syltensis]
MNERQILPAVVVALLALLALVTGLWVTGVAQDKTGANTGNAADAAQYRWKMVTTFPKNFPGLGTAPEEFARRVRAMSNGRIDITVYGAGEIVQAFEVFDAVSQGVAELGYGAAYYWKGKIPASVYFTAIPFGMTTQEMNAWLHYGGGLELWRELYAPFNLVPFAAGSTGVQMAGWFNKALNSVDDVEGLMMRIPGMAGEVFSGIGGSSVRIAGGEIYTSMQTGVIDAVEWVGPFNDRTMGLQDVAEYYYYPGWHEPGTILEITINGDVYAGLPDDLRAIIEGAARAVNQDTLDFYTARNNEALQSLIADGTKLRELPPSVVEALYAEALNARLRMAKTSPLANRIEASYREFEQQVTAYHDISERAYLNLRAEVSGSTSPGAGQANRD